MSRSRTRAFALPWRWLPIAITLAFAPLRAAQEPDTTAATAQEPDDPILAQALTPWTGDLDGILKRGMLRVAIPYGLTTYFMDGPEQRGLTYDSVVAFEQSLKKKFGKEAANLTLVILPTNRARLLPMLTEGLADLAAGTITVTQGRRALVAFSEPIYTQVREVLVTGPAAPAVSTAEDLLASALYLRRSTSFFELQEPNIHAGVKYLRFLRDRYFSDPVLSDLDRTLFSFAAYNAGLGNVAKARKRTAKLGLDPNRWFDNVEIAAAQVVSREPVIYVRNIYKYYVAYKLLSEGKTRF